MKEQIITYLKNEMPCLEMVEILRRSGRIVSPEMELKDLCGYFYKALDEDERLESFCLEHKIGSAPSKTKQELIALKDQMGTHINFVEYLPHAGSKAHDALKVYHATLVKIISEMEE